MSLTQKVNVVVLAESGGRELEPLSAQRAKAAIPFGSKYRIIDFALANCLHSGLRRVFVFTQYKSHSLAKHLRDGWSIYNPELGEYITMVSPQMHAGNAGYSGSANAIYQNLFILRRTGAEHVLILPGDTVHRMDYEALLEQHMSSGADATLVCKELADTDQEPGPTVAVTGNSRIESLDFEPAQDNTSQLVLGIVAIRLSVLEAALEADYARPGSGHDLIRDVMPELLQNYRVRPYPFGGSSGRVTQDRYWRSLETLDGYYQANMDLLKSEPPLDLYQSDWTIRTYQSQNPPARTVPGKSCNEGIFINSVVGGGTVIAGGGVNNSILFSQVRVGDAATIENSIIFEGVNIAERAQLRNCIIDKYVRVPAAESIGFDAEKDAARFTVSDNGIVVVPRGYVFE
ncbi:MAG: sugar phosphate nucleotidyltransferase [Gammaproteobacteria bacterium]|nr:sugar phosphate nucleotidyltransferase [Gammaproteobacteria bacterium]